jgi:hypothetical protein
MGPDERRVQHWLRRRGVGPDALGDTMATDWWSTNIKQEPACGHEHTVPVHAQPTDELVALLCVECDEQLPPPPPEKTEARWLRPEPDYYPRPHLPAAIATAPERASAALSPKTRRALYNASAAGAGWGLGLYQQCARALADCGQQYSVSGALVLGVGGCLVIAHVWDRRTRHWWPGIAWAARIPLATAFLALALWAPAA